MNTSLKYGDMTRVESEEHIITSLIRKGWTIIPEPEPPPTLPIIDHNTHKAIYDAASNTYSVIELSNAEKQAIEDMQNNMLLLQQKSDAKRAITDQINNGYSVQPEDFILGLSETDRTAFTQLLLLVREAIDLGLITNADSQVISDKSGVSHSITVGRFRQIMVAYGVFYKGLWDQLNQLNQ